MTVIYVDADACPVKAEAVRVADRWKMTIYFVSNSYMRLPDGFDVQRKIVSDQFDAADDWIEESVRAGDVVVTADIQLADRCLKAGAIVLGHDGAHFSADSIGMALAMRALKSDLREMGEISGAGPSFSKKDRSRFLESLELAVRNATA